ncbi:MAG TPA: chemotaxis protein CheB [Candidatus Binatia bacterium]|nr:chemotaxis protein CheB [Candidatus Binatia bacterium]
MKPRDIVVIGASAGGIGALVDVVSRLPSRLPATLFVAVHSSANSPGLLPELLSRAGPLPAEHAVDGQMFQHGRIYVAPPDRHLLVEDGTVMVTRGPHENLFRPAVDPLFRSAARSCGDRVVAIVLSGGLDDGSQGLRLVKQHGGVAVVQDMDDALVPGMPASALRAVTVDHVRRACDMGPLIAELADHAPPLESRAMRRPKRDVAETGTHGLHEEKPPGELSGFTCPACGGALWEESDRDMVDYACHVGHRFTGESLATGHDALVEGALWSAVRALEEKAAIRRRLAQRAELGQLAATARVYERSAADSEQQANAVRALLTNDHGPKPEATLPERRPARRRKRPAKRKAASR